MVVPVSPTVMLVPRGEEDKGSVCRTDRAVRVVSTNPRSGGMPYAPGAQISMEGMMIRITKPAGRTRSSDGRACWSSQRTWIHD